MSVIMPLLVFYLSFFSNFLSITVEKNEKSCFIRFMYISYSVLLLFTIKFLSKGDIFNQSLVGILKNMLIDYWLMASKQINNRLPIISVWKLQIKYLKLMRFFLSSKLQLSKLTKGRSNHINNFPNSSKFHLTILHITVY